jgi:arylsulfatase A-like enzyme
VFFVVTAGGLLLLLCFVAAFSLTTQAAEPEAPPVEGGAEAGAVASSSSSATQSEQGDRPRAARPNIIVVYLDDMRADDLSVMNNVKERIVRNGVSFSNSIVSTSACCPARATHLSGRYSHNTGVLHNSPPHGGYGVFRSGVQADGETLPIWLRNAGYRTMHIGKLMNHYPDPTARGEVPPGFTDWYGLYEGEFRGTPYTIYRQTRYVVRVRPMAGQPPVLDADRARYVDDAPQNADGHLYEYYGPENHQTEVLMDGAVSAVKQQRVGSAPLYMNVWLTAPHTGGDGPRVGGKHYRKKFRPFTTRPAQPELRELHTRLREGVGLGDLRYDKPGSFNERNVDDKPAFVRGTARLDRVEIRDVEIRNALRLASLKSVDRRIDDLLDAIEETDRRTGRDSFVIFSSDGGYFLGEHRFPYEKNWHYGPATDVPLIIRGPGVQRGVEVTAPVGNIDLAPTLLDMASEPMPAINPTVDGRSLLPLLQRSTTAPRGLTWQRRALLLEGFYGKTEQRRYAGVRNRRHVYVEHYARSGGEVTFRELYDLRDDPAYQRNLLHGEVANTTRRLSRRLARTLRQLRDCAGHACRTASRTGGPVDQVPTVGQPLAGDATAVKSTTRSSIAKP